MLIKCMLESYCVQILGNGSVVGLRYGARRLWPCTNADSCTASRRELRSLLLTFKCMLYPTKDFMDLILYIIVVRSIT